eukprot:877272-Rhodomonas_salina.3
MVAGIMRAACEGMGGREEANNVEVELWDCVRVMDITGWVWMWSVMTLDVLGMDGERDVSSAETPKLQLSRRIGRGTTGKEGQEIKGGTGMGLGTMRGSGNEQEKCSELAVESGSLLTLEPGQCNSVCLTCRCGKGQSGRGICLGLAAGAGRG